MENLNLRVFRRTSESIALLFNKKALTESQLSNVTLTTVISNKEKPVQFVISDEKSSEDAHTPDNTTFLVIGHALNGLDPYADYTLNLSFGSGTEARTHRILIYAFGVLPVTEKDDKKLHVHDFGWCEEDKKWVKLPVVKLKDGSYAVAMVIINK